MIPTRRTIPNITNKSLTFCLDTNKETPQTKKINIPKKIPKTMINNDESRRDGRNEIIEWIFGWIIWWIYALSTPTIQNTPSFSILTNTWVVDCRLGMSFKDKNEDGRDLRKPFLHTGSWYRMGSRQSSMMGSS